MTLSKVPPAQLLVLVVLIVGGLGFVGFKYQYEPAQANLQQAAMEADTARQARDAAVAELERVKASGPDWQDLSRAGVSNVAVPAKAQENDAYLELARLARRSGVKIRSFTVAPVDAGGAFLDPNAPPDTGPKAIAFTIEGFARYPDLLDYIDRIESTVRTEAGQVFVRGRLFSVQSLAASPPELRGQSDMELASGTPRPLEIPEDGRTYVTYTLVVHAFTRSQPDAVDGPALGDAGAPDMAGPDDGAAMMPDDGMGGVPAPGPDNMPAGAS